MTNIAKAGTFKLGSRTVKRLGYGAMQLAGPGVWGPPRDRDAVDCLEVVNLRVMFGVTSTAEGSIEAPLSALVRLQREGKGRHIGLSNVTPRQVEEGLGIAEIVCVQNHYNLAHRDDDALIDRLAARGIAYVPFFPLGGFSPLQSTVLSDVATKLRATPMQVALAWLLKRSPNLLLIPGTSRVEHLRENLAAAKLEQHR
jgi:pyridoxine 4-dehydrogenase